ncbi:DUF3800 domain-containing protein [Chloroflexales bacterium ZM16-3]|nr:DUF3800 domain-containing protein [Chloroflexales bacterium ZM16-3]
MTSYPSHLVYIDDSGTKEYAQPHQQYGRIGVTRYFVFGAVIMPIGEASLLRNKIVQLKTDTFGRSDVEIKSNWMRMPEKRKKHYLDPCGIDDAALEHFTGAYYDLIVQSNLQIVAAVVDKAHMQELYPNPWYAPAVAYDLVMQRVAQTFNEPECVGILIDDMTGKTPKGNDYKKNLQRQHAQLRQRGSSLLRGIRFDCLLPGITFKNSAVSHLIQVADIVSYNIYRQFCDHGEHWEEQTKGKIPLYPWFRRLLPKFRQGPNRRIQGYGVVKMPMKQRVRWSIVKGSPEEEGKGE